MLEEGWNFRGRIALPLETTLKEVFVGNSLITRTFDTDMIESGGFVEVMLLLLRTKGNIDEDVFCAFLNKAKAYIGQKSLDLADDTANDLYTEFRNIFDS